jgi:hypothetical protein
MGTRRIRAALATAAVAVAAAVALAVQSATSTTPAPRGEPPDRKTGSADRIVIAARVRPSDAISITFPTPYAIGDSTRGGRRVEPTYGPATAQSYDNYHVILEGPKAAGCRGGLSTGYLTERRRRVSRTVRLKPSDGGDNVRTWCPGAWRGRVEYRQPDREPVIAPELLGAFRFAVSP